MVLPECEYGVNCYRKNPQHIADFAHNLNPKKVEKKRKNEKEEKKEKSPKKKSAKTGKVSCANGDSFEVNGNLVWGHFKSCYDGTKLKHNQNSAQPEKKAGGTIIVSQIGFRVAAKKGTWMVKHLFKVPRGNEDKKFQMGFIIYHEDEDPIEIAKRCAKVQYGDSKASEENRVIYVNRYDWDQFQDPNLSQNFEKLLEEEWDLDTESLYDREMGHFMTYDPDYFGKQFTQTFIKSCKIAAKPQTKIFSQGEQTFGTFVSLPADEYELGSVVFSQEKDKLNECIGFVYDGIYSHEAENNDEFQIN